MPNEVVQLLDPEIVNPSPSSSRQLEFWSRMLDWASADEMRLGPSTLAVLGSLVANPPVVRGLAMHDFWAIVGRFISRGVSPLGTRTVCDHHLRAEYAPALGADENIEILLGDLKLLGSSGRVALGTDSRCWIPTRQIDCEMCTASAVSNVYHPNEPMYSRQVGAAWRAMFLEQTPADLSRLERISPRMFPDIEFSSSAWKHLNSLSAATRTDLSALVAHLGVLNDAVHGIWAKVSSTSDRQAALGSLGVSASLEGPRTHGNRAAMKARDFEFSTGIVRCEWHTKLNPNIDRIHFAVTDAGVLVGTIVDHLPL